MGSFTPPPTTLAPGDRLDRYELLCVLAQGGMGTVWLARMTGKHGFERLVALKTILATYSSDRQFGDMFLDEARIAAQIDHENVARILEIGEDRGLLYYAMELIDGESLRKLYRDVKAAKVPFPMGVALRIVADACAGLHATHELHGEDGHPLEVVHRDVSPQNLLVSIRGTTKLIDFGVAKANARRSEETAAGTLKGKIEYMAPEQARGEPLDRRADVYALGAVLYELLCGNPVRDTDDGRQLVALHDLMTGVPYTPLPNGIPHLVRGIVDRALARDPRQRFASAEELRHSLEQAMLATGQGATTDDVAGVLAHFSRERTAKRKDAIENAIRAAAAANEGRINAQTIIAPISLPTQSHPSHPSHASQPGYTNPIGTMQTVPFSPMGSPSAALPGAPLSTGGVSDGPTTGPSMRTIGAASMSASARPSAGSSAARVVGGALVLGLVALLGVALGVVVTRRGGLHLSAPPPVAAGTVASGAASVAASDAPPSTTPAAADPTSPPAAPPTGIVIVTAPASSASAGPSASSVSGVPGRKDGGTRKPKAGGGAKPSAKQGDGDEYGF